MAEETIILNQEGEYFGKDETIALILNGTEYTVELDVSKNKYWIGNKVIEFASNSAGSQTIKFKNDIANQLGYSTDNGDLVIKIFAVKKDKYNNDVADTKTVIGTVRIENGATNFFDDATGRCLILDSDKNWDEQVTDIYSGFKVGDENATRKQILKGSYLSENFYCGKGDDVVDTGTGGGDDATNTVYLNTGNAVITLCPYADDNIEIMDTFQPKTMYESPYVAQEGIISKGGSTIIESDANDQLILGAKSGTNLITLAHNVHFYRKDDDLVVIEFLLRDGTYTTSIPSYEARVNIEDYFDSESKIVIDRITNISSDISLKEENLSNINNAARLTEGKGTLKGTFGVSKEAFIANEQSTIYTSDGSDDIYLSGGNDRIIADKSGNKNIYASGATGHATVEIKDSNANINLEYLGIDPYAPSSFHMFSFKRNGNDLVIAPGYGYHYASAGADTSSVTIKEYFKNQYNVSISDKDVSYYLVNTNLYLEGKTNKKNTLYGTNYNDYITGGKKKDVIYTGDGDDTIYTTAGNDKIVINGTGEKRIDIAGGDVTIEKKNNSVNIVLTNNGGSAEGVFKKNGSDLIAYFPVVEGTSLKLRTVTIKNAYDEYGTLMNGLYLGSHNIDETIVNAGRYISGKGTLKTDSSLRTFINGSAKADKVTIDNNVDNVVMTGKGNDKVTINNIGGGVADTGAGNDTIDINKSSEVTIFGGKGNDKINIKGKNVGASLIFGNGDGKDTINFDVIPDNNINLTLASSSSAPNDNYAYTKSGDNLVITRYHENAKGKKLFDTVTINDYFSRESGLGTAIRRGTKSLGSDIYDRGLIIKGTYNKKTKTTYFSDTYNYRDIINGTKGKDVIAMTAKYDGYDSYGETVAPGKGNDTIILENDHRRLYLNIADGDGKDTLILDESITDISYTNVNVRFTGKGKQAYTKSGDDLVIHNIYESKGNIKENSVVIQDFYKSARYINAMTNGGTYTQYEYVALNSKSKWEANIDTKRLLTTGVKNDTIVANADAIIFSGKGKDNITVKNNAKIYAGKGNDTIKIAGSGGYNVQLNYTKGDGNDTIIAESGYSYLQININGYVPKKYDASDGYSTYMRDEYFREQFRKGNFKIDVSGNDLVFTMKNGKKKEKITFKDACLATSNFKLSTTSIWFVGDNSSSPFGLSSILGDNCVIKGEYKKSTKTTTYNGLPNESSNFVYSGKGKAIINAGTASDKYTATLNANSNLQIMDYGGNNDQLIVNANLEDICIFFDVGNNGNVPSGGLQNLILFNKDSVTKENIIDNTHSKTGKLDIASFFGNSTDNVIYGTDIHKGTGYTEHIYIGNNYIDTTEWLKSVSFEVTQWMVQNSDKGYGLTSGVFAAGTDEDKASLLAIYQKHTADMYIGEEPMM